jgi:molybdopterin converting factor small subunit
MKNHCIDIEGRAASSITVRALGIARSFMDGTAKVNLQDGATVEELLRELPLGLQGLAARKELTVIVNGGDISAKGGFSTPLHDGDQVFLLPLAHGGGPL